MVSFNDMENFTAGIDLEESEGVNSVLTPQQTSDILHAVVPVGNPSPWHPRITFDIALGEVDPQTLCDRYNITRVELDNYYFIPAFRKEVADHQQTIRENGVTFKQKARVQAEMYLEVLDDIVNDGDVSAATRLDAIKSVVKWGELEPKEKSDRGNGNTPQFNIQINL